MTGSPRKRKHAWTFATQAAILSVAAISLGALPFSSASGSVPPLHMRTAPESSLAKRDNSNVTVIELVVTNSCGDTIYPAVTTQNGDPPEMNGFQLDPGDSATLHVNNNWQGRIWGRTNCSFPNPSAPADACGTGDCGGSLNCTLAGKPPATLAEFTLLGSGGQSYYDISLVDGFNLDMAILLFFDGTSPVGSIPSNKTNPSCVASLSGFMPSFNPYSNSSAADFLGTNGSTPLPFVSGLSDEDIIKWCPWDLQLFPPQKPGDGVYAYPDDNIQRPIFQPCYSTCAKYNQPADCCTGSYNSPSVCKPGLYSQNAKKICPDAYTYAYDDRDSTFTGQPGASFGVVFCPEGQSTAILRNSSGLASRSTHTSSASAEGMTVPWIFTGLALLVVALVFSSL